MTQFKVEMLQIAKNAFEAIMAQREEILSAFIAKYGFEPDEALQIEKRNQEGTAWYVVKTDDSNKHLWDIKQQIEKPPVTQKLFKYDVGDEVWVLLDHSIRKAKIIARYYEDHSTFGFLIQYSIDNLVHKVVEKYVFPTKAALIKSLEEQVE